MSCDHSYEETIVPPTKTEDGYTIHTCSKCGDSYTDTVVLATGSLGLAFTSNGDGTCYVSGKGICTDTDIIIPSVSPDGDSVTSIGFSAFYGCTALKDVYYTGTAEQWKAIAIWSSNSYLTNATIHYNYKET